MRSEWKRGETGQSRPGQGIDRPFVLNDGEVTGGVGRPFPPEGAGLVRTGGGLAGFARGKGRPAVGRWSGAGKRDSGGKVIVGRRLHRLQKDPHIAEIE